MKRRTFIITPDDALAVARAAAIVPVEKRAAFLKGFVIGLRGIARPDSDQVATQLFQQWKLAGVVPRPKPKPGFNTTYRRAA